MTPSASIRPSRLSASLSWNRVSPLISTTLIAAFGDKDKALMMYDTSSALVASGPGAECLTVAHGKITYNRFIFDRVPFAAAREAMP